jgi:small nuclear ribonucleoprotein (snRNP)-like protein
VLYILALALLPGALGDWFYRTIVGVRWGESQWTFALRLLGFSIAGLLLFSLFGLIGAPEPTYIFPNLFSAINPATLPIVAVAYLCHCAAGAVVGAAAAFAVRLRPSGYPCAWDVFVRKCASNHMVAVTLDNKETYVGVVRACDVTVEKGERDLVLAEPAVYDETTKNYVALPYQDIFVRADLVYCVAAIHDPSIDKRMIPVGESPFKKSAVEAKASDPSNPPPPS